MVRLESNFVPRVGWSLPWIAGGGGAGVIALLALGFWAGSDYHGTRKTNMELRKQAQELRKGARTAPRTPELAPLDPENVRRLRAEIEELDSLLSYDGPPFLKALSHLEKRLPAEVVLENLRYSREQGELRLDGRAQDYRQLTSFLGKLEGMAGFRKTQLVRQTREPGQESIDFRIRLGGNPR